MTANRFDETIGGTRLNIHLLQKVSDGFVEYPTFRNEEVKLVALTVKGDGVQLIKSLPTNENTNPAERWTKLVIRPNLVNASPLIIFGASYLMGYHLFKTTKKIITTPIGVALNKLQQRIHGLYLIGLLLFQVLLTLVSRN